jgi:hypothetical protein
MLLHLRNYTRLPYFLGRACRQIARLSWCIGVISRTGPQGKDSCRARPSCIEAFPAGARRNIQLQTFRQNNKIARVPKMSLAAAQKARGDDAAHG